jgi:hypothetical protein
MQIMASEHRHRVHLLPPNLAADEAPQSGFQVDHPQQLFRFR